MSLNFTTCERSNRVMTPAHRYITSAVDHIEVDLTLDFRECSPCTQAHLLNSLEEGDIQHDDEDCPKAIARRLRFQRQSSYSGFKLPSPFGGNRSRCFLYRGVTLAIHPDVDHDPIHGPIHRALIRATGETCLRVTNVIPVIAGMLNAMKKLGVAVKSTRVRRLDVAIDLAGIPLSWFEEAKNDKAIGGRYRSIKRHDELDTNRDEGVTGYSTTGGGLLVRVYDRKKKASKNPETLVRMRDARWGGKVPKEATRIEVQFRSEKLRALDSVTFKSVASGWRELTRQILTKWMFIRGGSRRSRDPTWNSAVEHLESQDTGVTLLTDAGSQEIDRGRSVALARQMVGVAFKLAAHEGKELSSLSDLRTYAADRVDETISDNKSRYELRIEQQRRLRPSAGR